MWWLDIDAFGSGGLAAATTDARSTEGECCKAGTAGNGSSTADRDALVRRALVRPAVDRHRKGRAWRLTAARELEIEVAIVELACASESEREEATHRVRCVADPVSETSDGWYSRSLRQQAASVLCGCPVSESLEYPAFVESLGELA